MSFHPSFTSPEQMQQKFDEYVVHCRKEKRFVNIAGFCNYVNIHRDTFYEYKNHKHLYSDVTKKIEQRIEEEVFESKLSPPERIFYLKNKFGYADKTEVLSHNVNVNVDVTPEEEDFLLELKDKYILDKPKE